MSKLILGCGYLGRRMAARWLAQGYTVHGLTRDKAAELRGLDIQPIVGDVRKSLNSSDLPPAETVLYAIAPGRSNEQTPEEVWITGLLDLIHLLSLWPTKPRLIFISSTSVYGQTDGEEVDEDSPTEPQELAGRVLVTAEQSLLNAWWPDAVVLRFAGIYGPSRLLRSKTIHTGEPIVGDADKWLNLIYVEDGADAILAAEARAKPGMIYNICDGQPVRRRDFYTRMAELLNAPPPRFQMPSLDAALPPHETANRRISNRRMREELKVELRYPNYEIGLQASAGV